MSEHLPRTPAEPKVKVGHLVTGLVFLGLAVAWALRANGTLGDLEIAVVVPVVLVAAGVIGLVALLVGNDRRRREGLETGPGPSPTTGPVAPSTTASTAVPDDTDTDTDTDTEPIVALDPTEKEQQ